MTIIVTKPGIIIDVVGSYFYDKKIMTENGLFVLGGPETQLHDILWPSMTEKPWQKRGRGKFRGVPDYGGRLGAERCAFLSYMYAHVCEALGSN